MTVRGVRARLRRLVDDARASQADVTARLHHLERGLDQLRVAVGRQQRDANAGLVPGDLAGAELKVFSQFGEDGIIQHLLRHVPIERDVFVEIGVEDYRESNTRFLLMADDWRGVIIDAGRAHLDFATGTELRWRHDLEPVSAFVTTDNINHLITGAGFDGDIGLVSIDVDGNDYWLLDALTAVTPRILIVEYNSLFGPDRAVTVPYRPDFDVAAAHWSHKYFGASLAALAHLADRKGYALVGSNRAGCNAFFVRRDVLGPLPEVAAADAWVDSRFRNSRGPDGQLTYLRSRQDQLALIAELEVFDVERQQLVRVKEL